MKLELAGLVFVAVLLPNFASATPRKDKILGVIRGHLKEARACYETALHAEPDLQGKVLLQWEISATGEVVSPSLNEAKSTLQSQAVTDCMLNLIKTWKFPKDPKGQTTSIDFPFVFLPKKPVTRH